MFLRHIYKVYFRLVEKKLKQLIDKRSNKMGILVFNFNFVISYKNQISNSLKFERKNM